MNKQGGIIKYIFWIGIGMAIGFWIAITFMN